MTVGDSRIFHTADWKIDNDPVVGPAWSSRRFRELGEAGIDAVICDSTNAFAGDTHRPRARSLRGWPR